MKQTMMTIGLMWLMIGFTIGFVAAIWWLKIGLGGHSRGRHYSSDDEKNLAP